MPSAVPANRTAPALGSPTPPPPLLDAADALIDAADALIGALNAVRWAARAAGVEVPREPAAALATWALLQRARAACPVCAAVLSGAPVRSCPQHDRRRAHEGRRRR